jgi:hypothetical protein
MGRHSAPAFMRAAIMPENCVGVHSGQASPTDMPGEMCTWTPPRSVTKGSFREHDPPRHVGLEPVLPVDGLWRDVYDVLLAKSHHECVE